MRKNEIKVKEKKIINKKIIYIIFAFFELFIFSQKLDATDIVKDSVGFDKYISTINEYVQKSDSKDVIDISSLSSDLIAGKSINYQGILPKILAIFFKEGLNAIQGAVTIFIVIVLMAVLSNLETEKDSSIAKISYFVCFLVIAIINIKIFIDVLTMFKQLISVLTTIMKVVSPFLLTILIATGAVSSSTIIQPMLLFLASLVNSVIEYIVIPFLSISVAFNIVDSLNEKISLNRISNLFSKSSIWIIGVMLTVFLGILSLETNVTSSVDSLAIKTTQAAVSNFVPVVGKFFSDSFETVVSATKVISSVGGTIGIIAIVLVTLIPIFKILSIMLIYMILSSLAEPVCTDKRILKNLDMFANVYKSILGILIGVDILFIISVGIIIRLSSSIIK